MFTFYEHLNIYGFNGTILHLLDYEVFWKFFLADICTCTEAIIPADILSPFCENFPTFNCHRPFTRRHR